MPGVFSLFKILHPSPRCVKCAGDHLTKVCTRTSKTQPSAVSGRGSPRSYLQCPKKPNNMPKKRKKNNNNKQVDGTVLPPTSTCLKCLDSRSKPQPTTNNQKPTLIPRQIALAQAKAHNQAVQPVPISLHRSHPSSQPHLYQTSLTYSNSFRDPEVIDLFNSLQTFIQIAKHHKTRSARLSALFQYIYNDSVNRSRQIPYLIKNNLMEFSSPEIASPRIRRIIND
ncbi:hypothetical protein TNCT_732921 [Trichonephila clavata]|uniref:Uncharacterized protein n=1 Tax=Trichonephila clavata TaxID=2740835 RepID=A0A8X6GIR6_TRICU|nr:hypothetical protein TNCT_732921 [Trichonephila clavata]